MREQGDLFAGEKCEGLAVHLNQPSALAGIDLNPRKGANFGPELYCEWSQKKKQNTHLITIADRPKKKRGKESQKKRG